MLPTTPICSFEPLPDAFDVLKQSLEQDANWQAFNFGVGRTTESKELIIAGNSQSSSFLAMDDAHISAAQTASAAEFSGIGACRAHAAISIIVESMPIRALVSIQLVPAGSRL